MTFKTPELLAYRSWLAKQLDTATSSNKTYATPAADGANGEPSEVIREALDAYTILIDDSLTQPKSSHLSSFLEHYEQDESDHLELYGVYIRHVLPTIFGYQDRKIKKLNTIIKKFNRVGD
jgi:ribosomal protein L16 Arg81 hydroxylase